MTDLEELLRDTLGSRASSITSGPSWDAASAESATEILDLLPAPAPRRPRRVAPIAALIAAAVVVAAVVGVLVVSHHGSAPNRAANQSPNTAPTVTRASCATSLPPAWRAAAGRSSTPVRDGGPVTLPVFWGTTSDGSAVVEYNSGVDERPIADFVGLLAPDSTQIHQITRIQTYSRALSLEIDVDQDLVVIRVDEGVNQASRWTRIIAFDARTGITRTVAAPPRSAHEQLTGEAFALDGRVYWETTSGKGTRSQRIRMLTMATGQRTLVARGVFDLEKSAAGVSWSLTPWRLDRPAAVPPVVSAHVRSTTYNSFVSDGASYAWQSADGSIEWWDPSAGHVIRVPKLLARPFSSSEPGSIFAVAGPVVVYQPPHSSSQRVLDVRTGATAEIANPATVHGEDGALVGDSIDPASLGGSMMRLDTSQLPALRC